MLGLSRIADCPLRPIGFHLLQEGEAPSQHQEEEWGVTLCNQVVGICEDEGRDDVSPTVYNFMQMMTPEYRLELVKHFVDFLVRKTCLCFMHISTISFNSARPPRIVPCLKIPIRYPPSLFS